MTGGSIGDGEAPAGAYEPNPKHKPIPSPGRHGSICPRDASGEELLRSSDLVGGKRYATDGRLAFCAQQHATDRWHGYPLSWDEVPPAIVRRWVDEGRVPRKAVRAAKRRERR